MELRELRSLVVLSDLGSISLVADHLHLTPPAIHKQLKTLETGLGIPLYEKVGRRLLLTQGAEVILPYLKDLLAQYDSALAALEEWKGMKRGLVRIGTGPSSYVLPAILKKFRHENPAVDVLVETGHTSFLLDELRQGSLDVVLVVSSDLEERRDFVVETSWTFQMVLVSPLRHLPIRPRLADLRGHRFMLFRKGSRLGQPIDRYFAFYGFKPNVAMRFDSADFILAMVRSGLGMSMLPHWVVYKDVKEARISLIRQAEPPLYSKIALVRRKIGYVPQPIQGFISTACNLRPSTISLLTMKARRDSTR